MKQFGKMWNIQHRLKSVNQNVFRTCFTLAQFVPGRIRIKLNVNGKTVSTFTPWHRDLQRLMLVSSLNLVYFLLWWGFFRTFYSWCGCFHRAKPVFKLLIYYWNISNLKKANVCFCTAPTLIAFLLFFPPESPGLRQHFCVFRKLFFFSFPSLESKDSFCLFHSCVVITPHCNIHSTLQPCTEPSPTWTAVPHSCQQLAGV